ncbi:MAG TPA: hypothetical protein VLG13_00120 [Patescibacteria group bacterium]|nr:hypothetical protein [Patescibacteria group bacterium]
MAIVIAILVVLGILVVNEWWWRKTKVHDELSRKFVHVTVGSFVAFWPFFLSWNEIRLLSLGFLVVVVASKYFKIFKAIHSVQRATWGEVYFALAVGLTTFITHSPAVYAAAFLQVGLADGLAALVGTKYGKGNDYKVRGHAKSLAGSGTFLLVSYITLLSFSVFSTHVAIGWCLAAAAAATTLENIAPRGLDNVVLPVFVAAVLRLLV